MTVLLCVPVELDVAEQLVVFGVRSWLRERARTTGIRASDAAWRWVDDLETLVAEQRRVQARNVAGDVASRNGPARNVRQDDDVVELTVAEAAKVANVSRQAIEGRIRRGTLHARRNAQGHRVVNREDL